MSLRVLGAVISLLVLIAIPLTTAAQSDDYIAPLNTGNTESPVQNTGQLYDLLITVVQWVYTIFYVIAVLFILIAAYNFITGAQSEDKIKTAKAQLKYAVIAIAIALVSTGVSALVKNFIENPDGGAQPAGQSRNFNQRQ